MVPGRWTATARPASAATDQVFYSFSPPGVTGVVGDWTGTGRTNIGDFSNGVWHLDLNGNGVLDPGETFQFGQAGDQPVVGDWDGNPSGRDELGVFRANPDGSGSGKFILDIANHHTIDSSCETFTFGLATDHIIVGDWTGTGKTKVGVYRDAENYIPADAGDIVFSENTSDTDTTVFTNFVFGLITDKVVIGDWNGSGTAKVAVYRDASSVTDRHQSVLRAGHGHVLRGLRRRPGFLQGRQDFPVRLVDRSVRGRQLGGDAAAAAGGNAADARQFAAGARVPAACRR